MAFAKAPRLSRDDILGNRVSTRSFKIFSDNQKTDPAGTVGISQKTRIPLRRKSITISGVAASNVNNMKKGISRIVDKGKSNNENSEEYTKVRRKALADLSNLGGNSGSSTMKWKGVKCGNLQRISVVSTRVNDLSVKKSTKEPESKRTTELGNNNPIKIGQKFIKSKTLSLGSTAGGTRKSLPTLKRTSLVEKSMKKYNVSSLNSKQLGQGPASKASNKGVSQLSSVHLVRKSIKIQKTVKTSLQNRSSLKKPPVGRISSVPSSDEVVPTLSLPKKVETECLKEDTQGQSSSSENKDPTTKVLDVKAKPKSKRRKSFTSLLVTGSKFDEKNGDTALPEKLPNIDDESNQLEVAEYVDDIYQFYWIAEALSPALGYYLSAHAEVSPVTRGILINWLIEVHFKFDLMHETLYLTMNLLDRYLSQVPIRKNEMQLIGLTALLLASKYEDYWHPRIKDLISISAESYTRQQILGMERIMLKQLKFRLNAPTPYVFMLRFLKAAQSNKKLEQLAFYLIELCLVEYEALKYKPSLLCASAIYVARCTSHMTPVWTPLLNKHTHYNVSQMKDSSDMILRFHKAAKTGKLRVTYEKYMNPGHSNVAVLKPLDKLPL
ncbi:PREDICTED: putative cyclin-B3-1 isoform X5 [Camelina sativa]|uniref:Cyclin-B3-1 isoform X1 n=1 Tax=Camelina sativa TaxID=90675 RepID=A0ABM0VPB5_CAMSA|nr:PREDICTED: putative cyclin-B3-1 isoform X1 [Camelina sativa]XP_010459176.1 PREDICTED: putative cyclin-B3-1 isoform X5 [Camelina sativa]